QLLGRLVEANDGSFWVVRTPVDVEHVLHAGDEVGVGVGRNDPLFLEVRLEDVFFRIRPMVLSLALATIPSSTTFSSSRRSVQCARPSGGFEQATAISFASASPSKIFGRAHAGLYCRVSTASNPSSTRRLRARETLLRLVSSASTICRSVHAGPSLDSSAFKRILARVATSTIGRPLCRNSSSRVRSSALSRTTYFFPPPRFLPATNHLHRQNFAMEVIHETDSDATTRSTRSRRRISTKPSQHRKLGASSSALSECTHPSMGRGSIWRSQNWRSSPANALIAAFQINKPSNARSPPGSNTATSTTQRPTGVSQLRPLASSSSTFTPCFR